MTERRLTLAVVALALTAVDLAQKSVEPIYGHPRGALYVVAALALGAAVVLAVPRVPSRALSAAAGVAVAGAAGNVVSALVWRGVPNPMVVGDVAFNIADVYAFAGACALVVGAAAFALRHPELLRQPI